MQTAIHRKVRECQAGTHKQLIARVHSGWLVMGDVQFVRGYCLILPDPVVPDLNHMSMENRVTFLREMSIVGDALLELTNACRINYEILGNLEPALHGHIFPRYKDEPEHLRTSPVWLYDWKNALAFNLDTEIELMEELRAYLAKNGVLK